MPDEPAAPSTTPPTKHGRAGRDLPAAILVGVGLAGALVASLLWFNWGFVIIVTASLCLGALELHQALLKLGMRSAIVPIELGTVLIVAGSYAAAQQNTVVGLGSNTVVLVSLGLTALAALIWRMPQGHVGYVRDAAASLLIIGYLPLLGSFFSLLLAGENGPSRVVAFLLCIVANDTGGYAVGVLFGKHPMAPKVSPKKTWEGFAGSVFLAVAVGISMAIWVLHIPWWVGLVLALSLVGFGTCGDLIESLIKRDVGIKDMSSFLPGHGGMLDRLDSLLVGAPAAWLVLYLFMPGG